MDGPIWLVSWTAIRLVGNGQGARLSEYPGDAKPTSKNYHCLTSALQRTAATPQHRLLRIVTDNPRMRLLAWRLVPTGQCPARLDAPSRTPRLFQPALSPQPGQGRERRAGEPVWLPDPGYGRRSLKNDRESSPLNHGLKSCSTIDPETITLLALEWENPEQY